MATTHPNSIGVPDADHGLIREFALSADVGDATRTKYLQHLPAFAAWVAEHGSHLGLLHATPADAHRFIASLRDDERPGGALSASTRKNYLASLRSFYRYCSAVQLVAADPTAGVRAPKLTHAPGLHLCAEEIRSLLAVSTSARDRIQTYLFVYTGARVGELRDLRWGDVDFKDRTLILSGKGDKSRSVSIHPVLMAELRRWHVYQDGEAEASPAIADARQDPSSDFVLLTGHGKPVRSSTLYRQLRRRACLAGLYALEPKGRGEHRSAVTPHALRRSFATILLNDGQPIDAVADVLGHASIDTTRRHYAFASSARQRATVEAFHV